MADTHPANPVQKRIYDILVADGALAGLVNAIYENPPDDAAMPYVKIGDDTFDDFSGHTFDGWSATLQIDVWTEGESRKITKTIMNRIYELLHDIDLAITDFKTICFRCILSETLVEPEDNRTYHGIQRYDLTITGSG